MARPRFVPLASNANIASRMGAFDPQLVNRNLQPLARLVNDTARNPGNLHEGRTCGSVRSNPQKVRATTEVGVPLKREQLV